jgi:PhzF family phenazine biosynthesis protein
MKFCTVDAFTHTLFKGNPAAVCVVDEFPPEDFMQDVATEVNLSETVFVVPLHENHYAIRWFTPKVEVSLCGHATLAAAHVLWTEMGIATRKEIYFESKSGILKAWKSNSSISLDFPAFYTEPMSIPEGLIEAIGTVPVFVGSSHNDYVVELHSVEEIINLSPDFPGLMELSGGNVIVTAEGPEGASYDYISRVFCPKKGIPEDPVTGSAHCRLATYWSERLKKNELRAYQASKRGGALIVRHEGDRVHLIGEAVTAFSGRFVGVSNS